MALRKGGFQPDVDVCILDPDSAPYDDPLWLEQKLRAMPYLPEAFFCANDFLALHLMTALKNMGYSVPEDVMVAGFDGSPESAVVSPGLTTAVIPSTEIGRLAAELLLKRIANPDSPILRVYVPTTPVWRASTR
jgi:LacI family transcriptional regulator